MWALDGKGGVRAITYLHGLETVGRQRDLHGSAGAHELVELLLELLVLLAGAGEGGGGMVDRV